MSYEGNELGYDIGYESDSLSSVSRVSLNAAPNQSSNVVRYYCIDPVAAPAVDNTPIFIPTGDRTKAKEDDKTQQAELLGVVQGGKHDGKFLIQDKDSGDRFLVSGEELTKRGIEILRKRNEKGDLVNEKGEVVTDISKAALDSSQVKKIPVTSFAAGQPELGKVEKSKSPKDPQPADGAKEVDLKKMADEAEASRWKEGGDLHSRSLAYGLKQPAIDELKNWSKGKTPQQIDDKLPPYDAKKSDSIKTHLGQEFSKDLKAQQTDNLFNQINKGPGDKTKQPGDPGYVSREDCGALVVQRYKMGTPSVDLDGQKIDVNQMMEKKGEVDGWVGSIPKGTDKGLKENSKKEGTKASEPSLKEVNDHAMTQEMNKAVNQEKKYFKGKDAEVNARRFVISGVSGGGEKELTPGAVRKFREERAGKLAKADDKKAVEKDYQGEAAQFLDTIDSQKGGQAAMDKRQKIDNLGGIEAQAPKNLDPKRKAEIDYSANKEVEKARATKQVELEAAYTQFGIDPNDPDAPAKLRAAQVKHDADKQGAASKAQADAQFAAEAEKFGINPKAKDAGLQLAKAKKKIETDAQMALNYQNSMVSMATQAVGTYTQMITNMGMEVHRAGLDLYKQGLAQSQQLQQPVLAWCLPAGGGAQRSR